MHKYIDIEDTVGFWFGANDTSGSGADGSTPVFDVRLRGAAADAIPVLSGAATLLTHANYSSGAHEVEIAATVANGFAANSEYGVFSTLLVDSQNPTGFIGSFITTALATSAEVSNIGSGSAGAVNIEATEDNASGAIIDGVTSVGTPTGTFANVANEDGVLLSIADVANDIDWVLGYDVGGARQGVSVSIVANLNGNNDDMTVKAYDHVGSDWEIIGLLSGSGGSTFVSLDRNLFAKHTGTGSELGKVYIRFDTDSTTPELLEIDKCVVSAVSSATSVGYALGAYWIDSAGTSGTEIGTNGTADNPCPYADALTMNASQPLDRFQIKNGNSVTLSANSDSLTLHGDAWTLALGGQSIEGLGIRGADVTGIGTATVTPPHFNLCSIGIATIPPCHMTQCGIGDEGGTFTATVGSGDYLFDNCHSEIAGAGAPVFDFTPVTGTTGISNRAWTGGATYTLDSNCTLSHEVLVGGGTTITTGGGDVEVRGICRGLTVTLSAAETVQFVGITDEVILNGTTTATVNLYGVSSGLTDNTSAATVTDKTLSQSNIDTIMDANTSITTIKGKTDSLTFTTAGEVDANIHSVNDTAVTGDGETGTEWGPV